MSFAESGRLGSLSSNPVSFYYTNIPLRYSYTNLLLIPIKFPTFS